MAQTAGISQALPTAQWTLTQGLITTQNRTQIPPQACRACANVVGFEGKLRRRPGFYAALAALPAGYTVHHLGRRVGLDGTINLLALARKTADSSCKVYKWTGAAWSDITGAASLTLTAGTPAYSTTFLGVWYFTTGGNNNLYSWSGSGNIAAVAGSGAGPDPFGNPAIVYSWDGRLHTFNSLDTNSAASPYFWAWSDHLLPDVWQDGLTGGSSGYIALADDSDAITGVVDQVNSLLIFKPTMIYQAVAASGPLWYQATKLIRGIGCPAGQTIRRYYENVFFLGDEDVYMQSGGNLPQPIGMNIRNTLKNAINNANMSQAFATMDWDNILYTLYLPKTGTSNLITLFTYSLRDQSWWEGEIALAGSPTLNPICALDYRSGPWQYASYVGSVDGKVYQMDTTFAQAVKDDTTTFTPTWTSPTFDALGLSSGKNETMQLQRVGVHGSSGKVKVQATHGPNLDSMKTDLVGTITLDGNHPHFLSSQIADRFIELVLTFDTTSPPAIEGLTVHLLPRGEVR